MNQPAIEVKGLGKRYPREKRKRANTLFGQAWEQVRAPLRNFRRLRARLQRGGRADDSMVWVLRDVSFAVPQGGVLGIIGPNGAGKSTLLKILSRVTDPTTGEALMRGRIASLLEVGTGFHEELTGRDNIFLNAAILGMTRAETLQRLPAIAAFSEVEQFLDTPLKFYSSGMKVRLAFSVAAHLDPEILIIDEVLAVGDLAFQKKCLDRLEAVSRSGRTVLFVSHHMAAVAGLCERCMVLEEGRLTYDGPVAEAIERYQEAVFQRAHALPVAERTDRYGPGRLRFTDLRINGGYRATVDQPVRFELSFRAERSLTGVQFTLMLNRSYQEVVLTIDSKNQGEVIDVPKGESRLLIDLPFLPLAPGRYLVDLWANIGSGTEDGMFHAANLEIEGEQTATTTLEEGVVRAPRCRWELSFATP